MKLILFNKIKNKYIGNNLVIYNSLEKAIRSYFDNNTNFENYLKDIEKK